MERIATNRTNYLEGIMMTTLTIVRGVSGSGKSTWANEQNAVVVSRDLIRLALFGTESMADERRVTNVEHSDIRYNLRLGKDVISDNTNIEWKFVKAIADIGIEESAEVRVKVFDVPLNECIRRNGRRAMLGGRHVPDDVIRRQYERFQGTKHYVLETPSMVPYEPPCGGAPPAVIVDIDGTLAHLRDRSPFDWKRVGEDTLDDVIAHVVQKLSEEWTIIVMSGRDGSCYDDTAAWLNKHSIPYDLLFMRSPGDNRRDSIVKYELFDKHCRDYDIKCVLDDRAQVVKMWRQLGLTCLQVAEGNF